MFVSEVSLAGVIVIIAGVISILALLVSKISLLIRDKADEKKEGGFYECGFKNPDISGFRYVSEKSFAVSLYLVFELSISWLLVCFSLDVFDNEWSGRLFIKMLSIVILTSILMAYKAIFNNKNA